MIQKQEVKVISNQEIAKDSYELIVQNDYLAKQAIPGQFLHLSVPNHTLRRPLSIASVNQSDSSLTLLYKVIGSGTRQLSKYKVDDKFSVLGPSGNGFTLDNLNQEDHVLLIGGGIGVPPLYFLAQTLSEKRIKFTAVLGFLSEEYKFYEENFKALDTTIIVTDDGSYGEKGRVTDLDLKENFTQYYSCGPLPMLKAVKEKYKDLTGYLSFEERMACGIGACYACVISVDNETGYKKICQDGPVFKSEEVSL